MQLCFDLCCAVKLGFPNIWGNYKYHGNPYILPYPVASSHCPRPSVYVCVIGKGLDSEATCSAPFGLSISYSAKIIVSSHLYCSILSPRVQHAAKGTPNIWTARVTYLCVSVRTYSRTMRNKAAKKRYQRV